MEETVNIDGRFLILMIVIILVLLAFINLTASIWLENQDHRKARAWDNEKCNQNFIDWLAVRVAANPFFKKVMVSFLIPVVAVWMLIRYPHKVIKRMINEFVDQVNNAMDSLRR